ncbi:MAG TPA: response regulator transcription factor [Clostridia bacterium]|nr:response regulator transcription factor [Clostridia bacterium]
MNKIRIVVVDDHPLLREGLIKILSLEDTLEVVGEAGDGETAVQVVEELQPQVVLMDINLPGMDGIQACKAIKSKYPEIQVIALTIYDDDKHVLEIVRAGANGYLLKDVEPDNLLRAIKEAAAGKAPLHPKIAGKLLNEYSRIAHTLETAEQEVLTPREREVLSLIAKGTTNRLIAKELFISEKTVKNHITNIFRKLEVKDRTEAVVEAMKRNII